MNKYIINIKFFKNIIFIPLGYSYIKISKIHKKEIEI